MVEEHFFEQHTHALRVRTLAFLWCGRTLILVSCNGGVGAEGGVEGAGKGVGAHAVRGRGRDVLWKPEGTGVSAKIGQKLSKEWVRDRECMSSGVKVMVQGGCISKPSKIIPVSEGFWWVLEF
jgi:hypothetical protein